jgi:hypothetical protein
MQKSIIQNVPRALESMLPFFGKTGNFKTGTDLPMSFIIDVPFVKQESIHGCGAACARMLLKFFNKKDIAEKAILKDINCLEYNNVDHETYEEIISQWLLTNAGILSGFYSPASHINPIIKDGIIATDFIRTNYHTISKHDNLIFKNLLLETKTPQFIRLHFTTDQYPMKQEIARFMDVSGHSVLLVGYDEYGFIFNDPWDKEKNGGTRGGKNIHISYEELDKGRSIMVNCSLQQTDVPSLIDAYFEHLPLATHRNRNVELELVIKWSGIKEIHCKRWHIDEAKIKIKSFGTLKFNKIEFNHKINLIPGDEARITIPMNTGNELGSSEIELDINLIVLSPKFPWVKNDKPSKDIIPINVKYRVSVQSDEFFKLYGMLE